MEENKIARKLVEINQWWNNFPVPRSIKKAETRRRLFFDIAKHLDSDRILAITGPRQVGKTTLMGQLIDHQIHEKKINPKHILYIPIDNEMLKLYAGQEGSFISCMEAYSSTILLEPLSGLKETVYIYLDEIQDLERWDKTLKSYYDSYEKIKFIITGSSHSLLHEGIRESLVGRIQIRTLLPFKFSEFVMYRLGISKENETEFNKNYGLWTAYTSFASSLKNNNPQQFYRTLTGIDTRLHTTRKNLQQYLRDYLIRGGFPHSINAKDLSEAAQLLKQDLELTVYKDIHRLFKTRDPLKMMDLLTYIAEKSNEPISQNQLAKHANTSWPVINNFLNHFQHIFLLNKVPFFTQDPNTTKSDMFKFNDTGILNTLTGQLNENALSNL